MSSEFASSFATLGSLLDLGIIEDWSFQTGWRNPGRLFSLRASSSKPLLPAVPKLIPGPICFMLLLKLRAFGLPILLGNIALLPDNCSLLGAGKWKIPEKLVNHMEHANAKQWHILKGLPILLQPANNKTIKICKICNICKICIIFRICKIFKICKIFNTYTRIVHSNKASTSAAFLGTNFGAKICNLAAAALFTIK